MIRKIFGYIFIVLGLASCGLSLNAPDDGNGGQRPDTTVVFQNLSSSNLPGNLAGTSQKSKAADIDGDGDLDLAVAVQNGANRTLINDGNGRFTDGNRIPSLKYDSRDVAAVDFDNDGDIDLFFVGHQNPTNEFYINNGNGSFSDVSNRIPVSGNFNAVFAGDIDANGTTDIMLGSNGQNIMLMNSGNANFTNQSTQRLPQINDLTQDVEFTDVNADNLRDIIVGNLDANRLLINSGSGYFSDQTNGRIPFISAAEETRDVEIIDADRDGDLDLFFGNSGISEASNPQDRLLINDGQGVFSDQTSDLLPAATSHTFDAEFTDLDNDNDLDIVISNYGGGLHVLINNGNGSFTDESGNWISDDFSSRVTDLEVADFNGDGRPDLYISVRDGQDQLLLQ